jgi:DNA-binding CsgD family transcriptional regulator
MRLGLLAIGFVSLPHADSPESPTVSADASWLDIAPHTPPATTAAIKAFVGRFASACPGLAGSGTDFPCGSDRRSGTPFRMSRHEISAPWCDGCTPVFEETGENVVNDLVVIPRLTAGDPVPRGALIFLSGGVLDAEEIRFLHTSAALYFTQQALWENGQWKEPPVALKPREIECIRWAVTGRTLAEIAAIMGLAYRTVRFHLDSARSRYGFSTNQQLFIQAAKDYGLDPDGAPGTIRRERPVVAVPQLRRMQPLWEDRRGAFDRRGGDRRQAIVLPLPFADRRAVTDRRARAERRAVAEPVQSSADALLTPEEIHALLK